MKRLAERLDADNDPIHLIDGFPMPVCKMNRAARSRCFQTEELKHQHLNLPTPLRKNMTDSRPKAFVKQLFDRLRANG